MRRITSAVGLTAAAALAAPAVGIVAEELQPTTALAAASSTADASRREPPRGHLSTKAEQDLELARLRLREGTRLRDATGHFSQSGDALTFIDEEGRRIAGLPNLNLERILRMLKTVEEPESIIWSVSGTITEFSGRNYLLISRAVYKAAAPPPAPEDLLESTPAPPEVETQR
ncbi:MAG TPA: hypothetical protein VF175_10100 [Lacipirellula sp.]